jgi:hypothetical protein
MLATSTIVTCPWITFEGIGQIATVEIMVTQIIVPPPDTLFDWIWLVVFQICVQFLQLQQTDRQTKPSLLYTESMHIVWSLFYLAIISLTSCLLIYCIKMVSNGDVAAENDKS